MAGNSDQFYLEVSARLKNDGKQLANDLKSSISEIEKNTKLNLDINDDKVQKYIEKLKKSMNEINTSMSNSSIEAQATSFAKFVDVLKEGAKYSKTIADNLERASGIKVNLDNLRKQVSEQGNNSNNSEKKAQTIAKNTALIEDAFKKASVQINDIQRKIDNVKFDNIGKSFKNQFRNFGELITTPIDKLKTNLSSDSSVQKFLDNIEKSSKQIGNNFKDIENDFVNKKLKNFGSGSLNINSSLYTSDENYKNKIDSYIAKLDEYKTKLNDVKSSTGGKFDTSSFDAMELELNEMLSILNSPDFKKPFKILADDTSIEEARLELEKLAKSRDNLKDFNIKEQANGTLKLTANYVDGNELSKVVYTYNDASKAVTKLDSVTKKLNTSTKQANSSFSNSQGTISRLISTYFSFYTVINKLKQSFEIVKDMDEAMTEMRKVSDETVASLEKYTLSTFDTANTIGTTGLNLQKSTADWMRLGKSIEEASSLAQDTAILLNVSEFDSVDEATESMVSMTQAYQELSSNDIVDKLNLTGNNYSIATDELAKSLQKSSSALKTAKNDFDEAIALTVAGNSVVQDPDSVAAGIRTIALRMTGTSTAKKELEELGESTDSFLTSSKLNETVERLTNIDERGGISLLDDNGNYRSTAQILIDLADRWEKIGEQDVKDGENRQNALLEALAGKNRSNILASILNDPELLKDVYSDVSSNYDGSALEENEKYLDSLNGRIKELQNNWEKFSKYFFDSSLVKGAVSGLSNIVDLLAKVTSGLGSIPTMIGAITIAASSRNEGLFTLADSDSTKSGKQLQANIFGVKKDILGKSQQRTSFFDDDFSNTLSSDIACLNNYVNAVNQSTDRTQAFSEHMTSASSAAQIYSNNMALNSEAISNFENNQRTLQATQVMQSNNFSDAKAIIEEYNTGLTQCGMSQNEFKQNLDKLNPSMSKYLGTIKQGEATYGGYVASLIGAKAATIGLQIATTALNAAITMGVSFAITWLISQFDKLHQSQEEVRESTKELLNDANEEIKTYEDEAKAIDDLISKYKELKSTGDNSADTRSQIVDIQNQIVNLVGSEAEGLDLVGGKLKDNVETLEKYKSLLSEDKVKSLMDKYNATRKLNSTDSEDEEDLAFVKHDIVGDLGNHYKYLDRAGYQYTVGFTGKHGLEADFNEITGEYIESAKDALDYYSQMREDWLNEYAKDYNGKFTNDELEHMLTGDDKEFSNDIYKKLVKKIEQLKKLANEETTIAKDIMDQQLDIFTTKDEELGKIAVNSVEDYEKYVETLNKKMLDDENINKFIKDGYFTSDDIRKFVNDYALGLDKISEYSDDWQRKNGIAIEVTFDKGSLDDAKNELSDLYSAIGESTSSTGLTKEAVDNITSMYSGLESFDEGSKARLFERTALGIQLNRTELEKLQNEYENSKKSAIHGDLRELIIEYEELDEKIKNCTDETIKANLESQKANKEIEINNVKNLASQYDALTSAYYKWEQAKSTANEGDKYDSYTENLKNLKELYNKNLIGIDDFQTGVQLMTNEDLSTKTAQQIADVYEKKLPIIKKFFKDGESGCVNFLNAVNNLNEKWAWQNKDGTWEFNFDNEKVAEELGISVDAIELLTDKLKAFGFVVDKEYSYDNIKTLIDLAKKANKTLKENKETTIDFNFETKDLKEINDEIAKSKKLIKNFQDSKGNLDLTISGAEEARTILTTLIKQRQEITKPSIMNFVVNSDELQTEYGKVMTLLHSLQKYVNDYEINIANGESTEVAKKNITDTINLLNQLPEDVKAKIGFDSVQVQSQLDALDPNVTTDVKVDEQSISDITTIISNITPEMIATLDKKEVVDFLNENITKEGDVVFGLKKSKELKEFMKSTPTVNGKVVFKSETAPTNNNNNNNSSPSPSRPSPSKPKKKQSADGTASFVRGSAFANGKHGDWGIGSSGTALVGELGQELLIRDGEFHTIGDNSAEFINYKPNDIIFNAKQTEQLFKYGKIVNGVSRGRALYNGTANGMAFDKGSGGKFKNNNSSSNKKSSSSSSSSNNKDGKSMIDDLFDWIEIRLQRLSNKTQKWITLAENAISKSVQKSHYTSAINSTATQLNQNQTAKDKYLAQANALIRKSGVKNASAYAKKVRDGSLSIQSITNEKVKDFVTSYKEMYDKAVECSNAVMDLTGELQDLAETLYNLPIEHAEKKVEKYSDKMDVLSAKYDTYRGYENQNSNLDEKTKLQKSIKNAYASAYDETKTNLKTAKSKINSTSDKALKGLTSAQKKKIVANVQAGKEINISNSYSASLKKALANYNAALEANRIASNESAKASAEYTNVLRENTNAKYENITAFYEQNRSLNEARISRANARLSYNEAVGFSAVSDEQRGAFKDQIDYNKNILNHYLSERALYDKDKLKKQYENGELSREDYFSLLSHIEELDEGIYDTTVAIEEAKKEIFNLNITRLDYIIDGIARAMERFKNIISLKEARDEDVDESYFVSQNESLMAQIERINEKRLDYIERMKDYDPESKEYQDLATKLAEADNEAMAKFIELEENKDEMVHNRFKKIDDAINKLNTVGSDIEHLRDLLSDDELIDSNGVFTDSGLAEIALVGELIDNNNQKIKDYTYGLEKLEENFKNGNLSPEEYEEKSREFIEGIQDSVKAIDGYNDSLVDLYSKQLEIENDSLKEVIENRKKALQSKKSYYDYDKTLKSANKDIVSLKNQIAALEGVGNAAAKAEVERLKAQLSEAETELEDTKYEHTVELQLSGYEEMSNSADKALNDLLDDLKTNAQLQEEVVSNMLDNVVKNYETAYAKIQKTINSTAISDGSFNSISKDGETFSTSVNTSYNDKNTSYGDIATSTINIGNQNTADIESSISGYQPSSNTTVNSINASTDNVKVTVGGNPATVICDPRPVTATDRTISAKASSSKVSVKVDGLKVIITGKSAGNCEVKITANDSGGKSQTISVEVEAAATPTPTQNSGSGGDKKDVVPAVDTKTETPKSEEKKSTAGYISSLSPVITSSSSSAYIKKVQTALNGIGVKGKDGKKLTVDGKWGTNTDYAVKTFQKSSKWGGSITADGKIGSKTKLKFKKAGYYKGGIVDNVITNTDFLNMIRMNNDDGLITAKLGEGIIPKNLMPNFASQIEKFNSLPADKIINSISNNAPNLNIQIDKFMDVQGNVDKNCVNDIRNLQNDITNNITKTLTQEFRKLGYK